MRPNCRLYAAILSSLLLASCGGQPAASPTAIPATAAPTAVPEPTAAPTATSLTAQEIAERLQSSTVRVHSTFPATPISDAGEGAGTGIVLEGGYIVTNAHVVEGGSSWTIATSGSTKERPAKLIGASTCDDIAVLKVDNTSGLQPATLGVSSDLSVGEEVVALGYPESFDLGTDMSVTRGIVSQKERQIDNYDSLIQTDAAINHGNSGGPLVNKRGEVIGINTLGLSEATNINFAISMDRAKGIIADLQEGKRSNWLGVNVVPNDYADYFGMEGGLVVVGVDSGSPAKKLDIQPADLLMQIEDTDIASLGDMCKILRSHSDGDRLKVSLLRVADAGSGLYGGEIAVGDAKADVEKLTLIESFDAPTDTTAGDDTSTTGNDENVNFTEYDFAEDTGTWLTGENEYVTASIGNGLYSIMLNAPDRYTAWPDTSIPDGADMGIVAVLKPNGNARAGVATRYVDNGDTESYYACWIDTESSYGCVKYVDSQLTTLQELTQSDLILPGQENTLTLVAEGTTVSFNINGTDVASFEDTTLTNGVPAIYVENFSDPAGVDVSYVTIITPK